MLECFVLVCNRSRVLNNINANAAFFNKTWQKSITSCADQMWIWSHCEILWVVEIFLVSKIAIN